MSTDKKFFLTIEIFSRNRKISKNLFFKNQIFWFFTKIDFLHQRANFVDRNFSRANKNFPKKKFLAQRNFFRRSKKNTIMWSRIFSKQTQWKKSDHVEKKYFLKIFFWPKRFAQKNFAEPTESPRTRIFFEDHAEKNSACKFFSIRENPRSEKIFEKFFRRSQIKKNAE